MLDGIRVLDLTWVLGGPFAGQLLAQLGAEVIKVEPVGGDMSRTVPPHFFDGDSSFFLSVNRGKRSLALDVRGEEGREVLRDLVRRSDAAIYGFAPDVPARLGLDHASLLEVNPRICVGQLIGIHDQGPYVRAPAFDLIVQALGGIMSITGEPGGRPVRVGYQVADLAGGLYLALGTVGALLAAARTGRGRRVQVSLLDCQLALLTWQAQNYLVSGRVPGPTGSRHGMIAPSEAFQGSDGRWFVISPTGERFWSEFCAAIGHPELAEDARFQTAAGRIAHVDELAAVLGEILGARPAGDWVAELEGARVPAAPVNRVDEALAHPAAALRAMLEDVRNPATGHVLQMLGNPFKYDEAPELAYPPALGGDTEDVLRRVLGYPPERVEALLRSGVVATGGAP